MLLLDQCLLIERVIVEEIANVEALCHPALEGTISRCFYLSLSIDQKEWRATSKKEISAGVCHVGEDFKLGVFQPEDRLLIKLEMEEVYVTPAEEPKLKKHTSKKKQVHEVVDPSLSDMPSKPSIHLVELGACYYPIVRLKQGFPLDVWIPIGSNPVDTTGGNCGLHLFLQYKYSVLVDFMTLFLKGEDDHSTNDHHDHLPKLEVDNDNEPIEPPYVLNRDLQYRYAASWLVIQARAFGPWMHFFHGIPYILSWKSPMLTLFWFVFSLTICYFDVLVTATFLLLSLNFLYGATYRLLLHYGGEKKSANKEDITEPKESKRRASKKKTTKHKSGDSATENGNGLTGTDDDGDGQRGGGKEQAFDPCHEVEWPLTLRDQKVLHRVCVDLSFAADVVRLVRSIIMWDDPDYSGMLLASFVILSGVFALFPLNWVLLVFIMYLFILRPLLRTALVLQLMAVLSQGFSWLSRGHKAPSGSVSSDGTSASTPPPTKGSSHHHHSPTALNRGAQELHASSPPLRHWSASGTQKSHGNLNLQQISHLLATTHGGSSPLVFSASPPTESGPASTSPIETVSEELFDAEETPGLPPKRATSH